MSLNSPLQNCPIPYVKAHVIKKYISNQIRLGKPYSELCRQKRFVSTLRGCSGRVPRADEVISW
jgi:hypothetical protein